METQPTPEQQSLLRAAVLHRPIARAASVARGNGLCLLFFGLVSVLVSLFGFDPLDFLVGAILTAVGVIEVRTSGRLHAADPAAPSILARNELVLMATILTYSVLRLTVLRESTDELSEVLGAASGLNADLAEIADGVITLTYSTFMLVTVLYQGGLSRYFRRRAVMIEAYRKECPEWARDALSALRA